MRILFRSLLVISFVSLTFSGLYGCGGGGLPPAPPDITAMTVPVSVTSGTTIQVSCTAHDVNGDPIVYSWSCFRGTIVGFDSSATYTAPVVSYDMLDRIYVYAGPVITSSHSRSLLAAEFNLVSNRLGVLGRLSQIHPVNCTNMIGLAFGSYNGSGLPAIQIGGMGSMGMGGPATGDSEWKYTRIIPDEDYDPWADVEENSVFLMPSKGIVSTDEKFDILVYAWFNDDIPLVRIQNLIISSDLRIVGSRLGDIFTGHEDEWELEKNADPGWVSILSTPVWPAVESNIASNKGVLVVYEVEAGPYSKTDPWVFDFSLSTQTFGDYFPSFYVDDFDDMVPAEALEFSVVGKDYGSGFTSAVEVFVLEEDPVNMGSV